MRDSSITVVIPVFNEELGIEHLKENLEKFRAALKGDVEPDFVFVDDGSSDRTLERLKEVFGREKNCKIVAHDRNRGVGAAFRTGFAHATGAVVCTIDADCTYGPEKLPDLIEALDRENADIAVASPYHPLGGVEGVPKWRLALSKTCSFLYRQVSPVKLYTYTSVFRAHRRRVVENVKFEGDGFVAATEILINAAKLGYKTVEVPMVLRARRIGTSKMKILRTIRTHLRLMFTGKAASQPPKQATATAQPPASKELIAAGTSTNKE